jgi:hypothetical protein
VLSWESLFFFFSARKEIPCGNKKNKEREHQRSKKKKEKPIPMFFTVCLFFMSTNALLQTKWKIQDISHFYIQRMYLPLLEGDLTYDDSSQMKMAQSKVLGENSQMKKRLETEGWWKRSTERKRDDHFYPVQTIEYSWMNTTSMLQAFATLENLKWTHGKEREETLQALARHEASRSWIQRDYVDVLLLPQAIRLRDYYLPSEWSEIEMGVTVNLSTKSEAEKLVSRLQSLHRDFTASLRVTCTSQCPDWDLHFMHLKEEAKKVALQWDCLCGTKRCQTFEPLYDLVADQDDDLKPVPGLSFDFSNVINYV